jgi:hypothetical protein
VSNFDPLSHLSNDEIELERLCVLMALVKPSLMDAILSPKRFKADEKKYNKLCEEYRQKLKTLREKCGE